ncbi:MAG: DUF2344 domain-containing protein [Fusobacteria bacterium]|nr:DUF2344 domain-containing protein [Fusobacteriota bacterium]
MKKRIFFDKTKNMVFISHLDTVRFFERLFSISKLKIKYTEGFNPRPKFSFGFALSLGVEAYNEPVDIEILEDLSNEKIMEMLNKNKVEGFKVVKVENIDIGGSISRDYSYVEYILYIDSKEIYYKLKEHLSEKNIISKKEKKGVITERDITDKIIEKKFEDNKITLGLFEISPSAFFYDFTEEEIMDIKIVRNGYKK